MSPVMNRSTSCDARLVERAWRELHHAMRDVEPDRLRAARGHREGDVARAGSEIERALAFAHIGDRHELRLPPRILSVRQHRGDQVVAIRDGCEQLRT